MSNSLLEYETERCVEGRIVHVGERPISFERFLDMAEGRFMELVGGIIVEKPMIQLDHELCTRWLYSIIWPYAQKRGLGQMLSSRIMVKTADFGGRMPDLLFVRQERMEIVQQRSVYGAPDLIIEVASPNDYPADFRALEVDYFQLGVPEFVLVHLRKQELRFMRRGAEGYTETIVKEGPVTFAALPGLTLQAEWILREPRPDVVDTLNALLAEPSR